MCEFHEARFLQETLKEQVSVSIREALEKTTNVLSNLHRVQSYLDLTKSVPITRSELGTKNALEQIRMVREDAATLLQTVYLSEIGLQSLQNYDKQCGASDSTSLMPLFGDSINSTAAVAIDSNDSPQETTTDGLIIGLTSADENLGFVNAPRSAENSLPPTKKAKLGVSVTSCSNCRRRFAAQQSSESELSHLCRNCKSSCPSLSQPSDKLMADSSPKPLNSSTPSKPITTTTTATTPNSPAAKTGRRNKLTPMTCKLCNTCFLYRRCLLRHLRENHTAVDVENLAQYVDVGSTAASSVTISSNNVSKSSSLNVTVGSEGDKMDDITMDSEEASSKEVSASGDFQPSSSQMSGENSQSSTVGNDAAALSQSDLNAEGDIDLLPSGEYSCPVCSKSFKRPYRLQRHLQIHDPNRPRVQCHICDRSFTRADTLENHIKCLHSEEKPFECTYDGCFRSFATQSTLLHHARTHTDGKPYKCMECDATFALLNAYKQHINSSHSDTKDLRCSECLKVFPVTADLEEHKLLEHRFECELCGKVFARLSYLETHVQLHSGDSLFNCRFCGAGFEDEYNYRNHVKIHPEYTNKGRKCLSYMCQACNQSFQQPDDLMTHYRSQEHRSKASSLGIGNSLVLQTIEGELSDDVSALVDEVTMATGEDDEDSIIQTLTSREAFQGVTASTVATAMPNMVPEQSVRSEVGFPDRNGSRLPQTKSL